MKFFKDWDEKIINNYKNIGDEKAIISSYPLSHEQEKNQEELGVPHMCNSKLNGDNVPMFYSEFRKPTEKPTVAPYTAAGLFFTKGKSVTEVPYDPYLPHLFQGEEFLHSARLWTHGWNFTCLKLIFVHIIMEEMINLNLGMIIENGKNMN